MTTRKSQLRILTLLIDNPGMFAGWDHRALVGMQTVGLVTSEPLVDFRGVEMLARVWRITDVGRRAAERWSANSTEECGEVG